MYLAIPPQKTCAKAWLSAILKVNAEPSHEAFNVIVDIGDPLLETAGDGKIIKSVDDFLILHDVQPLQAIANTIFPYSIYKRYGCPRFYDVYLDKIYPKLKQQHEWGRYFERIINCRTEDRSLNPLAELIDKLRQSLHVGERMFHNTYEVSIYDPALDLRIYDPTRDANRRMNRQCLSFLSFKLDKERRLSLTAVYRNHFYVARLLGNMIGLGRLLEFVTIESGAKIGSLTILSTHAEVDTFKWNRQAIKQLIDVCGKC